MATYLAPSAHIYDPHASSSQEYYSPYPDVYPCQPSHGSHYYTHSDDQPADYLVGASAMSVMSANNSQVRNS